MTTPSPGLVRKLDHAAMAVFSAEAAGRDPRQRGVLEDDRGEDLAAARVAAARVAAPTD